MSFFYLTSGEYINGFVCLFLFLELEFWNVHKLVVVIATGTMNLFLVKLLNMLVISIPAYIRSMEKKELYVVWSIHFQMSTCTHNTNDTNYHDSWVYSL